MANIAEGFDSQSDAEFIRFLIYARRSISEVQSHLYVALNYIQPEQFNKIYQKTVEVKSVISGFIRYLENSVKAKLKPNLWTLDLGLPLWGEEYLAGGNVLQ